VIPKAKFQLFKNLTRIASLATAQTLGVLSFTVNVSRIIDTVEDNVDAHAATTQLNMSKKG
jgi:hypothetical protein